VTLAERPILTALREDNGLTPAKEKPTDKSGSPHLGIKLAELTQQLVAEKHLGPLRGLYVKEVDPNGLAAEIRGAAGQPALSEGDVITRINRVPVTTLAEFERVLAGLKSGDPIVLNVSRYIRDGDRITQRIVQFTFQ
jgi:S1-C subfamily serine protease